MEKIFTSQSGREFKVTEFLFSLRDNDLSFSSEVLSFYVVDNTVKSSSASFEFAIKISHEESEWLASSFAMAKSKRDPILVEEYEWINLQPRLLDILERARQCTAVKEFDDIVSDYQLLVGEHDDRGMLDTIMTLRNAVLEHEKLSNSTLPPQTRFKA